MVESAGILVYRRANEQLEFFLVHPGGPFFARKDEGIWTIPKGLVEAGEDKLDTAKRELLEETGFEVAGEFVPLGFVDQKGGKWVHCFAVEFDLDASMVMSNTFQMIWPPGSGRMQAFPEVDRAGWFDLLAAKRKLMSDRQNC